MNIKYPIKNNIVLFQRGPLSQWWGGYRGQKGGFNIGGSVIRQLTNDADISDGTVNFNCAEQWMMAAKALLFRDYQSYGNIMNTTNPRGQRQLGRRVKNFDLDLWNDWAYKIVLRGNLNKFSQNKKLKEYLLSFHLDIIFAEAAPWDKIWGIGLGPDDPRAWDVHTWQGQNLLGRVIKDVQNSL